MANASFIPSAESPKNYPKTKDPKTRLNLEAAALRNVPTRRPLVLWAVCSGISSGLSPKGSLQSRRMAPARTTYAVLIMREE